MVQLVGSRVRALGRAEWDGDAITSERTRRDIIEAALVAQPQAEALALLRGYQAQLFVQAYTDYLRTGIVTTDLLELGGGATAELSERGLLTDLAQAPHDTDLILSAMFKRRFNKLVAARHPALALDPVEERVLLGYLMQHPTRPEATLTQSELDAVAGDVLLRRIQELSALEPTYPVAYARGIVLFRMGRFEDAAIAFDSYLLQVSNGPYRLRAVNYLKAAVEQTEGE